MFFYLFKFYKNGILTSLNLSNATRLNTPPLPPAKYHITYEVQKVTLVFLTFFVFWTTISQNSELKYINCWQDLNIFQALFNPVKSYYSINAAAFLLFQNFVFEVAIH